jgi:tRNA threonylcarbamoyl adenosine modification protein (Sua5/YciO/YrdC/YwlC family)
MQRVEFHTENPNKRDISMVAERMNQGDIAILPTDSVYAIGCTLNNRKGIERICKITGDKEKFLKMSIICPDISTVSEYTPQITNSVFREMKKYLPGPYTFILPANKFVRKYFKNGKEEIGIRIPENETLMELLKHLDEPLITTSLYNINDLQKFYTDPDEIEKEFLHTVDILIDGGIGNLEETTVLDCSDGDVTLIRQGKGAWE